MEQNNRVLKDILISAVMCLAPVLAGFLFIKYDQSTVNIIMIYLLCSVLTARFTNGIWYALFVALMGIFSLNYFFVEPLFQFTVYSPTFLVSFSVIFAVTALTSIITSRAMTNERKARQREEDANILYTLASELASSTSRMDIIEKGMLCIHQTFGCSCAYVAVENDGQISQSYIYVKEDGQIRSEKTNLVRNIKQSDTILESGILKGNLSYEWPIQGFKGLHGYLGIPIEQAQTFSKTDLSFVGIIADSLSIALGRLINLEDEQQVKQEAEQERYKSNLLRSISHDIRNPLTGIMGNAQLIMNDTASQPEIYKQAEIIRKQSAWLLELVSNILSLTRMQNGTIALNKEVEIVEDVVAEAINQVKVRSPNRTVEFDAPAEVIAAKMDPKLIQQVVINLIDNAFKHTTEDEKVWVVLREGETPDWVTIEVHDRGEGLSKEAQKKIFEIFYTTHDKDIDTKKGYGLGLPICDSIMKAHGGYIKADNNKDGKGAVFEISFPAEMNEPLH